MIKYLLRENLLTANPDDCMAQVTDARTYTQDDIAEEMIKRGSSLTRADIAAYQKLESEVYAAIIADGGHINTPLINTSFSITGVFTTQTDSFDKTRHAVKLNINPGSALRDATIQAKVQKVEGTSTDPYIASVSDKVNGTISTVSAGSVMELTGARLKFDAADIEQGVFAVTALGEYRCSTIIENKPARLMVLLPADMPAGEFIVEVRTKLGTDRKPLRTMKKGSYNKPLTAVI